MTDEGDVYQRLRTYLCSVVDGVAAPGVEPEDDHPEDVIAGLAWLDLWQPQRWDSNIRGDAILFPHLERIAALVNMPMIPPICSPASTPRITTTGCSSVPFPIRWGDRT